MVKIIWTEPSIKDLQNILEYIQKDAEYYAKVYVLKLVDSTEKLIEFPELGRITPETNRKDIREMIVDNYRIIYLLKNKDIYILTVIHCKRILKDENLKV